MEVAVTSGRGKTGRAVIGALEARGIRTRALGRAETGEGAHALAGVDAVYLLAPNMHADEPAFVSRMLDAARAAGAGRIVYHSVAAPYLPEMPHHLGKAEAERIVRAGGLEWTVVQPCAYVQNFLPALRRPRPALTVPYDPHQRFSLVDLADVAALAAVVVADPATYGATIEVAGPEHVSITGLARVAGEVLGREVAVEQVTAAEWARGPGAALGARERTWLAAMFEYYNAHGLLAGAAGARALLGREPTTVEAVLRRELG